MKECFFLSFVTVTKPKVGRLHFGLKISFVNQLLKLYFLVALLKKTQYHPPKRPETKHKPPQQTTKADPTY